jgi:uridine kinase
MATPNPHLLPLAALIDECRRAARPSGTAIVGIDGIGGSGKSTLANAMRRLESTIVIVQMDDFYRGLEPEIQPEVPDEPGAQIDWRRLVRQVLEPLDREEAGRYQRFDWDAQELAKWHNVPAGTLVLLEGVYATREELAPLLDLRIWVETPREASAERGIARDGEQSRDWWLTQWLADERRYVAQERPADAADIVVDGTDGRLIYERGEYVRLR